MSFKNLISETSKQITKSTIVASTRNEAGTALLIENKCVDKETKKVTVTYCVHKVMNGCGGSKGCYKLASKKVAYKRYAKYCYELNGDNILGTIMKYL